MPSSPIKNSDNARSRTTHDPRIGMPMRGSWVVLLLALSLFLIGELGIGLLISSVADTQQVAFQAALLVSFLPTLMLSGFIFPIASMPRFLQIVTYAVPA